MYSGTKEKTETRTRQPQQNLQITTIRSFEGGLNTADTDLNMSPKYAKVLDNVERGIDGTLSVRYGTKILAPLTIAGDTSDIVNIYYFNGYIIAVQTSGKITRTDASGVVTQMQVGGVDPWPAGVTFVSFTIFNSDLIMCNGRNKPLIIAGDPNDLNYMLLKNLVDLATLSNVNTPIGTLCCSHAQFLLIAGVPSAPSTLFISARGTSGTFLGDPPPNDAVALDVGPRVSLGSSVITGLVAYRDKLLVTFERGVLPLNLGVYTGSPAVHTPSDDGFVEEFGCLAHRSLVSLGDDTFYADNIGVNSISRVVLYNTLRPSRASHLIDPTITALIQPLSPAQINRYVFAVYDMQHSRYMLFVPTFNPDGSVAETIGLSYTNIPSMKIEAWARLRGWKWQCGCRTSLQNVVFGMNNKLYAYDFYNQTRNADFVGDPAYNSGNGMPIDFQWELPWGDFQKRMEFKETRYIGLDTTGSAAFTVRAYADNIVNYGGSDAHVLQATFTGGSAAGYGNVPYGSTPYGGGHTTRDERLFAFHMRFKLLKLIFSGSSNLPLKFISVSIAYLRGSIRR